MGDPAALIKNGKTPTHAADTKTQNLGEESKTININVNIISNDQNVNSIQIKSVERKDPNPRVLISNSNLNVESGIVQNGASPL